MEAVAAGAGCARTLVRSDQGEVLGWYIAYLRRNGISQVLHVAAPPRSAGVVLDHLLWEALPAGSAAVQGRVEPPCPPSCARAGACCGAPSGRSCTATRPCWARWRYGESLVTRLDGEWWMGHPPHADPGPYPTARVSRRRNGPGRRPVAAAPTARRPRAPRGTATVSIPGSPVAKRSL